MSDALYLLASPAGWIALDGAELQRALDRAASLTTNASTAMNTTASDSATPALLTADEMAQQTGVPSSWWMTQARERRLPHVRIGRRVRFNAAEVLASETFRRAAIPPGGAVRGVTGLHDRSVKKT